MGTLRRKVRHMAVQALWNRIFQRTQRGASRCRHSYRERRRAHAVRVLECSRCGEVTLRFDLDVDWTAEDQRIVERYYVRQRL